MHFLHFSKKKNENSDIIFMKQSTFCVKPLIAVLLCALQLMSFSCVSSRNVSNVGVEECSRTIYVSGKKTAKQLAAFFASKNPDYPKKRVLALAKLYVKEAASEGINADVAFVQMCLETGFLRYGNLVTPDMNNYCGLGAIDAEHPGERFATPKLGVRAHIQHLHAYGTTEDVALNNECIDRRYRYVNPRGKAPTVFELAGTWAGDRAYGEKLDRLLSELGAF